LTNQILADPQVSQGWEIDMELRTGVRVTDGERRGTVLEVRSDGVVRVAWDAGDTGHKPIETLRRIGKDAGAR
jgi:hypothetical protein